MEIQPSEEPTYEPATEPPAKTEEWDSEKVARTALTIFSLIACCVFFHGVCRKKRTYSLPGPLQPLEAVEPLEPGKPLPPIPRCEHGGKCEEKARYISKTTAENTVTLLVHHTTLEGLGEEIDHIHPFAFLSAHEKQHVRTIFNENRLHGGGSLKRRRFIGGVRKGMERELAAKNIARYIPDFAKKMDKDPALIRPLIEGRDWLGLVNYLFDTNAPREE